MTLQEDIISVGWICPSNIALVKYWGKRAVQLPANPSLSFTLSEAHSTTKVRFHNGQESGFQLKINGESNPSFDRKVKEFMARLHDELDFIHFGSLEIESSNTFPHSSGIASSASGMGALALCLCSIESQLKGLKEDESFFRKASRLARLGSGSASRSIYGPAAIWGSHMDVESSHDEFATPISGDSLHSIFDEFHDSILIVSSKRKSVSSSIGHSLMESHPYLDGRLAQAERNIHELLDALRSGNMRSFIRVVENEALSLHGLMLSSAPGYVLMEPATVEIIKKIQTFREHSGLNICFTLDAGPNVHVLYPKQDRSMALKFIEEELVPLCEGKRWIDDKIGFGPKRIEKA